MDKDIDSEVALLAVASEIPDVGKDGPTVTSGFSCRKPSVTIANPKGGETFATGDIVDIFWTSDGCQVVSLRLALSTDGGAHFTVPVATSPLPSSGFYRWTVPDVDATAARLQATLLGQGDVELASDSTDGDFTITPVKVAAPEAALAPPPDAGTSDEPIELALVSLSFEDLPAQTMSIPPDPAPVAPQQQQQQRGTLPPTVILAKRISPTVPPETIQVAQLDPAMPEVNDNQALTAETPALFAPSLEMGFSFLLGALLMLVLGVATQKILRERKSKRVRRCVRCDGTGEESSVTSKGTCGDCDGTGSVEEEEEKAAECKHCEGEGEDPCHECKGVGKAESGEECMACKGGGKTLGDEKDGEAEPVECEICNGEGEVSITVKKKAVCEKCGGTGKS